MDIFDASELIRNEIRDKNEEEHGSDSESIVSEFSNEQCEMAEPMPMPSKRKRLRSVFVESSRLHPTKFISSADKPQTEGKSYRSSSHRRPLSPSESVFKMPDTAIVQKPSFESPNNIQRNVSKSNSVKHSPNRSSQLPIRSRPQSISVDRIFPGRKRSHSIFAEPAYYQPIRDGMRLTRRNSVCIREANFNELDNTSAKYHTPSKPKQYKAAPSKITQVKYEGISAPIHAIHEENDDCIIVAVTPTCTFEESQSAIGNSCRDKGKGMVNGFMNMAKMRSERDEYVEELRAKIRSLERTNHLLAVKNKDISLEYERMLAIQKKNCTCD